MKHGTLFVIAAGSILAAALPRAEAQTAAPGTAPGAQAQPAAPGTAPGTQAAQGQTGAGFQQPRQGQWQNGPQGRFDQRDQANSWRDDWQADRRDDHMGFADSRGEQHRGEWQDVRHDGSQPLNHIAPTEPVRNPPPAVNSGNGNARGSTWSNLATAERDAATDRADIRGDRRDIRQDDASLRTDRRDLRHDYAEQRAGDNEQAAIRQERGDIRNEVRDIGHDEANLRATEQNLRTERQDVREDRADLHHGSSDPRNQWQDVRMANNVDRFGQNYAGGNDGRGAADAQRTDRNWQSQSGWHTQGLTPTTLARNAADEKTASTTARDVHHAWYHYFW